MLAGLKGINGPELSVIAGHASGVNDGAAAGDDARDRRQAVPARRRF